MQSFTHYYTRIWSAPVGRLCSVCMMFSASETLGKRFTHHTIRTVCLSDNIPLFVALANRFLLSLGYGTITSLPDLNAQLTSPQTFRNWPEPSLALAVHLVPRGRTRTGWFCRTRRSKCLVLSIGRLWAWVFRQRRDRRRPTTRIR